MDYDIDMAFKGGRYKLEINSITYQIVNDVASGPKDQPVSLYMMNRTEFEAYMLNYAQNYDGPNKKAVIKTMSKQKTLDKSFLLQQQMGVKVLAGIEEHLNAIDASLLLSMKKENKDDW